MTECQFRWIPAVESLRGDLDVAFDSSWFSGQRGRRRLKWIEFSSNSGVGHIISHSYNSLRLIQQSDYRLPDNTIKHCPNCFRHKF